MRLRRIGVSVCGVVLALAVVRGGLAGAAAEEKSPFAAADAQILSEIREHSEAAAFLVGSSTAYDASKRRVVPGFFYSLSDDLVNWSQRKLVRR